LGKVEVCSCGHIHVHIQAITIRLDTASFTGLTGQFAEALHALTARLGGEGTAWSHGGTVTGKIM